MANRHLDSWKQLPYKTESLSNFSFHLTEEQQLRKQALLLEQIKQMKDVIDSEHIKGKTTNPMRRKIAIVLMKSHEIFLRGLE